MSKDAIVKSTTEVVATEVQTMMDIAIDTIAPIKPIVKGILFPIPKKVEYPNTLQYKIIVNGKLIGYANRQHLNENLKPATFAWVFLKFFNNVTRVFKGDEPIEVEEETVNQETGEIMKQIKWRKAPNYKSSMLKASQYIEELAIKIAENPDYIIQTEAQNA